MTAPNRPALRWHGGKWLLAPWIIAHFPPHRIYVEPYGGAASVLLRKERSYSEVYNDLDDDVTNLFKVLRSDRRDALVESIALTPFSRTEFRESYEPPADRLDAARKLVIRSFMGFGSNGHNPAAKTGFRSNATRQGTTPARDWANLPDGLRAVAERLMGVVIENRDALEVLRQHDSSETLHYVDPPYLPGTRSQKMKNGSRYHAYAHEMDESGHAGLLGVLASVDGMVVLSGYPSDLYDSTLGGWQRVERRALADGARERTEVLWINPAAAERMSAGPLFGEPAGAPVNESPKR